MSHTKVKTQYATQAEFGSTEYIMLYCHHNHSTDFTTFYDADGHHQMMLFNEWETGNDLYDAMERLWYPFVKDWGKKLKDKVEFWTAEDNKLIYP